MIRVGVIGASGYAGAELVRILAGHPQVKLTSLTCRQDAGERFDRIYPAMSGWVDLVCEAYDAQKLAQSTDLVFTALPHELPMALVPELLAKGVKVVDLSADFRFKNAQAYEAHYQPHTAVDLLQRAVYGLCEVYTDQIKTADLIGNPIRVSVSARTLGRGEAEIKLRSATGHTFRPMSAEPQFHRIPVAAPAGKAASLQCAVGLADHTRSRSQRRGAQSCRKALNFEAL